MATIGALMIKILADTDQFRSELEKSATLTGNFMKDVERGAMLAAKGLAALTAVGASAAGIAFLITKSYANSGEELLHLSEKTGDTVESLSSLREVSKLANVEVDVLAKAYKNLSVSAFDAAQGSREQRDMFAALNIQYKDSRGELRPATQLMLDLSDRVRGLTNETERLVVVQKLLGKAGQESLPYLLQGSAAIEQQRKEVVELGVAWTEKAAVAADNFNDNLTRLGIIMDGVRNTIGAALLPVINEITVRFIDWYKANKDLIQQNLASWAEKTARGIESMVRILADLVDTFGKLAGGPLGEVTKSTFQGLAATFTLFSHAIRETAAEIDIFFKKMGASKSVSKLLNEALAQGRKDLDAETKGKLARIFSPGPEGPPPPPSGGPAGAGTEKTTKQNAGILKNLEMRKKLGEALAMQATVEENLNRTVDRGLAGEKFRAELGNEQIYATKFLMSLMPELTGHEANLLAIHNQEKALGVIDQERMKHQLAVERIDDLQKEVNFSQANFDLQNQFYQNAPTMFGNAARAQTAAIELFEAQEKHRVAVLDEQLRRGEILWTDYYKQLVILDLQAAEKREGLARQFPGFWQTQLNQLVQSNTFSLGSIVSTWTSGIAQMIVKGGDLKAAWEATQIAMVQAGLNSLVQYMAQEALKTIVSQSNEAARVAANGTANATIVASNSAAAGTTVSVWSAAYTGIAAALGSLSAAVAALWAEALLPMFAAVGTAIMTFLEAVADAMTATIFGIPVAIAIMVGVVAIAAALAAMAVIAFADGGIVTGPTLGLVGEAGPEAIIPLDRLGDMSGERTMVTQNYIYLDGREIAGALTEHIPGALRGIGILR